MDLQRLQKLAGLPITESVKRVDEGRSHNDTTTLHASEPTMGQMGTIVVLDDCPSVRMLAKILGVPDGWELTRVGDVYAAYLSGDRLTFLTNDRDFQPLDDDEEMHESSEPGSFSEKTQKKIIDWAQQGSRVVADGKTIWAGTALVGDAPLDAEIDYQWRTKGENFKKKLAKLKADVVQIKNGYSAAGKKVWGDGPTFKADNK